MLRVPARMLACLTVSLPVSGALAQHASTAKTHALFEPLPAAVAVPESDGVDGARNPIDRLVRARLAREGLEPAPEASPERLLRRATLSLTGLPPTPEQLDAFLAAPAASRLEDAIESLLASPAHAERMASDWLDLARYADTYGYQSDVHREVWPYRDWVLRAFRDNMAYDRFVTAQLAGDLLPGATRDGRLATAFNRLHRQTNEGGSVEEEFRVEYVADRVHTFGTAFLGLTLECARCHDHKFDPVSQREYYALTAFFDDIDECGLYSHFTNATPTPALDLPREGQQEALDAAQAEVEKLERQLTDRTEAWRKAARDRRWTDAAPALPSPLAHYPLDALGDGRALTNTRDPEKPGKAGGDARVVDGAVEVDGDTPLHFPGVGHFRRSDPFTIAVAVRPAKHHARAVLLHRSRAWTDAGSRGYELLLEDGRPSFAMIHFWPGDAVRIRSTAPIPVGGFTHIAITHDGSGTAAGLRMYLDGEPARGVEVVRDGLRRTIRGGGEGHLTLGERFRDNGFAGGRFRNLTVFDRELAALEVAALRDPQAWDTAREQRQEPSIEGAWCAVRLLRDPELSTTRAALTAARHRRDDAQDAIPTIMTMRALDEPRAAYVLHRGQYDQRREPVEPGTPACLPPLPDAGPRDRLALARWLTEPSHPLTARVAANRIWQMHFGRGLVATPEDFGTQGSPPSHPELLDWLARYLVDSGWDLRALHRVILDSATWRQASTSPSVALDPDNLLLSRGPRFQLPAETIRDAALLLSDQLVTTFGGPSVKPYQPDGLWKEKSGATYHRQAGGGSHRRSLYTYWKRTSPPPAMMLLDHAKRDVCLARRQRTVTPLQALLLWNDPQYVEAAHGIARRVRGAVGDEPATQAGALLRLLTQRAPEDGEVARIAAALEQERAAFRADPQRATALLSVGDLGAATPSDDPDLAALASVASALLSLDEVTTLR